MKYNRITASAVSHEVRNVCGAISMLCSNLDEQYSLSGTKDYQGLAALIRALEKIAQLDLQARAHDTVQGVPLQPILDNLRIMIEPDWSDADGRIHWHPPADGVMVVANPHGLLQAFLNLARNSLSAALTEAERELWISVEVCPTKTQIQFADSGPGVATPEKLFQPFQPGAEGTGMGLHISRAIVRSYGGDMRFVPRERGSCFVVELLSGTDHKELV